MKHDLQNIDDIKLLVNTFYEQVKNDDLIAGFFTDVIPVDWDKHLPKMYSFWENVLFHTGSYSGNPMLKHQLMHQKCPMHVAHFKRWLQLFYHTVDELFAGENAILIKQRAASIASVMQTKILY